MTSKDGQVDTRSTARATEAHMRRRIYHPKRGTPEGELARAAAVTRIVDQQFYSLVYRIPNIFNDEVPNPSKLLWHYGFRLDNDGSVWVLPESSMNSTVIKELRDYWGSRQPRYGLVRGRMMWQKVKHNVIEFAESQRAYIMRLAREALSEEIVRAQESLGERMANAEATYKKAVKALEERCAKFKRRVTAPEAEGLEYSRILSCQAALRTAKESLDTCMECLCLFEMQECEDVGQLVKALESAVAANEATIKAMKEVKV